MAMWLSLPSVPRSDIVGTMTQKLLKLPSGWSRNKRFDRGITENVCTHGVGHPDPSTLKGDDMGVHGCDGCCMALSKYNGLVDLPAVSGDILSPKADTTKERIAELEMKLKDVEIERDRLKDKWDALNNEIYTYRGY